MKQYYLYILASHSNDPVLYIGVTNDLDHRILEHKTKAIPGFTADYNCDKLVFFEETSSISAAIAREKQLKNWHRDWKLNLIRQTNPDLKDLSRGLQGQEVLKRVQDDNKKSELTKRVTS